MATKTFLGICEKIDETVMSIDGSIHKVPVDVSRIERELDGMRELSGRIRLVVERLRETWG